VSLFLQVLRLRFHSSGKLLVQAAVVSDHSPIRRHLLLPVPQLLFCSFGNDANKYSCRQRAGSIDSVIPRKPGSDFGNGDEPSLFCFSDQRIDINGFGISIVPVPSRLAMKGGISTIFE
jgi:hypothetical protein